ncbi:TPA: hypothetical protein MD887_005600 [Klebsiella oxytoca]|uniref:hypothetical protein n=1 Tax=Enterobacteriaceae TaxID=543 RepID=UPI00208A3A6E|nr:MULTISPECIES: hypothetical protein [Enterobacteriaceae]HDU3771592.1 hypothetical protein [Klebsiella aerogenes]MDV0557140.1 hypothetical protein [Citrobacter portucalensis]MDV0582459.1 hypothetical protein [Citrobacter portucalensis]MEB0659159.1 hypothetical protein [Citrobacter portucalensis]MEB0699249.1 hypothetical protein [Citrobacter portucalensis]
MSVTEKTGKDSNYRNANEEISSRKRRFVQKKRIESFISGKTTEPLKRESFQDNSEVNLLDWIKGERAIFFAWVYVKCATCDILGIKFPELGLDGSPYKTLSLPENPVTSKERLSIIQRWFCEIEKSVDFRSACEIMLQMRTEWLYIQENINPVNWIRKTDVHTRWLWGRLKKDELFTDGFLSWFNPANPSERLLAINAAIDFFTPSQTLDVQKFTRLKNNFVSREKRNYNAHTAFKAKKTCQVSVDLSPDAKIMLDKLVKSGGKTQSATIEWLIRDRWTTTSSVQDVSEQQETNSRFGND